MGILRTIFAVGDVVKRSDATEHSIPAFKAMRGVVVEVHRFDCTKARVHWRGDDTPDYGFRDESTIAIVEGE